MIYDFRLCARKDGTFYGTAGQCRKGVETDRLEEETTREKILSRPEFGHLSTRGRKTANELLNRLSDEEFAEVANMASEMLLVRPSPKVGIMTPETVKALQGRSSFLEQAAINPALFRTQLQPVKDQEVEAMWSLLTPALKNKAAKNTVDGIVSNTGMSSEEARKGLLRKWMEQGGRDLFSGRKINFIEAELEHIQPFATLGDRAHSISNLGWIQRDMNQQKGNTPLREWISNLKNVSQQEAQRKYSEAIKRTNNKGDLKTRVKEDVKLLNEQSEKLIKEYGKYAYYFLRETGFTVTIKQPNMDRPRGMKWMRTVETESGKKEKIENVIIRKLPQWSPKQRAEAIKIVKYVTSQIESGKFPLSEGNQLIYDELSQI